MEIWPGDGARNAAIQKNALLETGRSIIDGTVLTETPIAQDVKTPVKDAFVPMLIQDRADEKSS